MKKEDRESESKTVRIEQSPLLKLSEAVESKAFLALVDLDPAALNKNIRTH